MLPAMKTCLRRDLLTHPAFQDPEERILIMPKLDGILIKLHKPSMVGMTKNGKKYDLKDILGHYPGEMGVKFHYGELVYVDKNGLPTRDRHKVMIVLRRQKGWEEYAKDIHFFQFNVDLDKTVVESYELLNTTCTYGEIYSQYVVPASNILGTPMTIRPMLCKTTNIGEAGNYFKIFSGYHSGPLEGLIVIKRNAVHHQFMGGGRVRAMHPEFFKIKDSYDATLRCVAWIPHSKDPRLIGCLVGETSDGLLQADIGIGLTKKQRETPFSEFLDANLEIEFERINVERRTLISARLKEVRHDTTPDSLEKLINRR